jgi:integrase
MAQRKQQPFTIYLHERLAAGRWVWKRCDEVRGRHIKDAVFAIRPFIDGRQQWKQLDATTLTDARAEADRYVTRLEAKKAGIAVPDVDNDSRTTLRSAVDAFLDQKSSKEPKTVYAYKNALDEFVEGSGVRYIDEIDGDRNNSNVLRRHFEFLKKTGLAPKTINDRFTIIYMLLKRNKIEGRIPATDLPAIEEEAAEPFSDEQLKKLWAYLDATTDEDGNKLSKEEQAERAETKLRYRFFLASACREQEVMYASWKDIDFSKGTFTVRQKEDVGFKPKNHLKRTIPLPTSVMNELHERMKNPTHPRWIFVNGDGNPEGHFLDKLKRVALEAGLNCGHCHTTRRVGRYAEDKKEVAMCCKDKPVCEEVYLHRFRKTRATQWHESNPSVPVRTIQHYLGHKSLNTTQIYLGISGVDKVRPSIDSSFGD